MNENCNQPSFIPRYRTIKECLIEIQALDPNTAVSEFLIRQLCKQNKVKYLASGNKSLVMLDDLLKYLGFGQSSNNTEQHGARNYPTISSRRQLGYFREV